MIHNQQFIHTLRIVLEEEYDRLDYIYHVYRMKIARAKSRHDKLVHKKLLKQTTKYLRKIRILLFISKF